MLSDGMALPRMRTTKNRELFLLKRKQEMEEAALLQSANKQQKQQSEFIYSYYLKVLNQIKNKHKGIDQHQGMLLDPSIDMEKYQIDGLCDIRKKSWSRQKSLPFRHASLETKPERVSRVKRASEYLKAVVQNGSFHSDIVQQKEKGSSPTLLKKMRIKNNMTMRIVEMKSSRSKDKSKTIVFDDNEFERSIQRTKYQIRRTKEKAAVNKQITDSGGKQGNAEGQRVRTREKSLESVDNWDVQDIEFEGIRKKYVEIIENRVCQVKIRDIRKAVHLSRSNGRAPKTFDLTGW